MNTYFIFNAESQKFVILQNEDDSIIFIPFDERNYDYQQYLAWLAEGNTPEEWKPETGDMI